MERIGLIDMGSNTVRLVVYEIGDEANLKPAGRTTAAEIPFFESVFDYKITLSLVSSIRAGILEDEAFDAAVRALQRHLKTAEMLGVSRTEIFATAFLRQLNNGETVKSDLEEAVGLPIAALSGDEEAHLGYVGAMSSCPLDEGTIVDLGGGSCELVAVKDGEDRARSSLPFGCVSAFSRYVRVVLPTPSEVARIQAGFAECAETVDIEAFRAKKLVGVGGTARFAASLIGQIWDQPTPKHYSEQELDRLLAMQEGDPHRFFHQLVLCDASRLHSAIPGMAILHQLMLMLGAETLHLSYRGVREGYLIERMLASAAAADE